MGTAELMSFTVAPDHPKLGSGAQAMRDAPGVPRPRSSSYIGEISLPVKAKTR